MPRYNSDMQQHEEIFPLKVGPVIRRLRTEAMLSLESLAARVSLNHSSLSRIEMNKQECRAETLAALAAEFKTKPIDIYLEADRGCPAGDAVTNLEKTSRVENPRAESSEDEDLLAALRKLRPTQQRLLRAQILYEAAKIDASQDFNGLTGQKKSAQRTA